MLWQKIRQESSPCPLLSVSRNEESKLRQLVQFVGLSEDAIRFVRLENGFELVNSFDSRDGRPLVVELAFSTGAPSPDAWLDILPNGAHRHDTFLLGSGCCGSYQTKGLLPPFEAPHVDRHNISLLSEVRFSDDALWGPLRSLYAKWPLTPESSLIGCVKPSGPWRSLISIGDKPWFLRSSDNGPTWFLWASTNFPDISEPLKPSDQEQKDHLLRLLPLLVFLRHAFGNRTWHAPNHFANLIIDDPPVRDRYGFFAPQRHLASLADIPHATTVGFIPWNWNRSTAAATELFRSHPSQLSLCIHGCDHTRGEFGSFNQALLSGKCRLALQRAERFHHRTGLVCEPVMVFPQGLFSKAAVAALRETNFLAAVNSTLFPVDSGPNDVCLADLIQPAFTGIENFPIFLRRYPRDTVLCAVDLFLGRPLLIVEHHRYFRDAYTECRRFLKSINGFQCRLSWTSLDGIVRRTCLQREIEPGRLEVRFYAHSFILENRDRERLSYRLVRRSNRPDLIRGVAVNGSFVEHTFEQGQVVFTIDLQPGSSATIQLLENRGRVDQVFRGSLSYRAQVWTRRSLCDLRDNHVWMSRFARWAKQASRRVGSCG